MIFTIIVSIIGLFGLFKSIKERKGLCIAAYSTYLFAQLLTFASIIVDLELNIVIIPLEIISVAFLITDIST